MNKTLLLLIATLFAIQFDGLSNPATTIVLTRNNFPQTISNDDPFPEKLLDTYTKDSTSVKNRIRYSNNQTGENLRKISIFIEEPIEEEDPNAPKIEMEEETIKKTTIEGISTEINFNAGRMSIVTLFLNSKQILIKANNFQSESELENIVKKLITYL